VGVRGGEGLGRRRDSGVGMTPPVCGAGTSIGSATLGVACASTAPASTGPGGKLHALTLTTQSYIQESVFVPIGTSGSIPHLNRIVTLTSQGDPVLHTQAACL
jgi:hypothetical protein